MAAIELELTPTYSRRSMQAMWQPRMAQAGTGQRSTSQATLTSTARPDMEAERLFAATSSAAVFLYSFNVSLVPAAGGRFACPYHCSELAGLLLTSTPHPSTPLGLVQESMGYYWLSFYRHGDPNAEKLPGSPHWPRYANQTDRSMVFALEPDGGIAVEQHYRKVACDYWTNTEHGYWDESGCWK